MTVVGVVGDVNQSALGIEPIAQTYEPIWQQPDARPVTDFYRTRQPRGPLATAIRRADLAALRGGLQRLDPELPLSDARPVVDVVADSVKPQRFQHDGGRRLRDAWRSAWRAIGIYGVLANAVSAADARDRRAHGARRARRRR